MKKVLQQEFYTIVQDILKNNEFKELDNEYHHGITRYTHSIRVAKSSYYMAKKMHLKNYEEVTRAALLHDFFLREELVDIKGIQVAFNHPLKACENSMKYFEISDLQKNIIESHMFPLTTKMPKYKESWLVSFIDKMVALYECARFKATINTAVYFIFIINMLTNK